MQAAAILVQAVAPNARSITSTDGGALADMRAYLARSKPQSPSEALRLLRAAYPEASLSLRVAACGLGDA